MSRTGSDLTCAAIDDMAPAYALGALDPHDERAISDHLAACPHPHVEARSLIDAAAIVPAGLEPVAPSATLRQRLMMTVAKTPQEHRTAAVPAAAESMTRRRWWQIGAVPTVLAAASLAAAVGLGAWGISLDRQLAERDAALRVVAAADAIHAVSGSAGSGWLIESGGQAMFIAEDLADVPADRLYELWLLSPDGVPTAVGTLTDTDGMVLVRLERGLGDAAAFAVTVEAERVDEPTTDPILVADLGT